MFRRKKVPGSRDDAISSSSPPLDESSHGSNPASPPPRPQLRSLSEPSGQNIQPITSRERTSTSSSRDGLQRIHTAYTFSGASDDATTNDLRGLNIIHDPPDADVDVIFVHGLGGGSTKTWSWQRRAENFWPSWLRYERGLPVFRIITFGYNADFLGSETTLSILDFAKDLLIRMRGYRDPENDTSRGIGKRPIVFVAHSMGGLVVKRAYTIGKNDPHFSDMLASIHGIMFLSTPHKGSSHASALNSFLSASLGTSAKVYVGELGNNSTTIQEINEQFRTICNSLKLVSIYETMPTKLAIGKRLIVGKDSGILEYPKEISSPMNADHHTVCKFENTSDNNYHLFISLLSQLTEGLVNDYRLQQLSLARNSPVVAAATSSTSLEEIFGMVDIPQDDLAKATRQGVNGTGQWLRDRDFFRNWVFLETSHKMIWLSGSPGAGKSTLAGVTVEHLHKRYRPRSAQYHFFDASQPAKRTVAYCLRSIAFQLAQADSKFAERVISLCANTGATFANQRYHAIWEKIYEGIIFTNTFSALTLHWVIDAIDEADYPVDLFRLLTQMSPLTSIKIMVLSRPNNEFNNLARSNAGSVLNHSISRGDTEYDMKAYVTIAVQELLSHKSQVQHRIIKELLEKADGSFLWARLALTMLRDHWHTEEDMQKALREVPTDMTILYDNMMEAVKRQTSHVQNMAVKILLWITCSFRALKIRELEAALQSEFGQFTSLGDTVVQICGHFVRVDDDRVTLVHATARKYLLDASRQFRVVKFDDAHDVMAHTCLSYLMQEDVRRGIRKIQDGVYQFAPARLEELENQYPLLQYSKQNWAYHFGNSNVYSMDLLFLCRSFFDTTALIWIHLVALSRSLKTLIISAQHLKGYLRRRRKKVQSEGLRSLIGQDRMASERDVEFVQKWAVDLIRLLGKFGTHLSLSPSTIYSHIPPLCPRDSIIAMTYDSIPDESLLVVYGIELGGWDDNFARLSVGGDRIVSKVVATDTYFMTLVSSTGTIIVWSAETCEELRRIEHGEWVVEIGINKNGDLMASAGRRTYQVWDITTGECLYTLDKEHHAKVMSLCFGSRDSEILICYDDCTVVRYDLLTSAQISVVEVEEEKDRGYGCPRLMVLNASHTRLAIAYRGRPVLLWDLGASKDQDVRRCVREADQAENEDEVWNAPEIARFNPNDESLYILYQDATIVDWRLLEDKQVEHHHTQAREMVLNHDGTFMLTSDRNGTLSVWTLPKLHLIYRLEYEDFVRDLAFSPDGQRIYDTRSFRCNVWEPDALVRADDLEDDDHTSSCDLSMASEPIISQDKNDRSQITSLYCSDNDLYFVCGKDDGSVCIHDMKTGLKIKKLYNHGRSSRITTLAWSASAKYIISGDNAGKVIAKRLRLKETGNWAVFPCFDFRTSPETVQQFLFSPNETSVLISTSSSDRVWGMKQKAELCRRPWTITSGRKWAQHPLDQAHLIWVDPLELHIHAWEDLRRNATRQSSSIDEEVDVGPLDDSLRPNHSAAVAQNVTETSRSVQTLAQTGSKRHFICETLPDTGNIRSSSLHELRLDLITTADLVMGSAGPVRRKHLKRVEMQVHRLLGCHRDRVIFVDHDNWICSWEAEGNLEGVKRHFFLPKDWLSLSTLGLITMHANGTLLCPRNGETAVVRYRGKIA